MHIEDTSNLYLTTQYNFSKNMCWLAPLVAPPFVLGMEENIFLHVPYLVSQNTLKSIFFLEIKLHQFMLLMLFKNISGCVSDFKTKYIFLKSDMNATSKVKSSRNLDINNNYDDEVVFISRK